MSHPYGPRLLCHCALRRNECPRLPKISSLQANQKAKGILRSDTSLSIDISPLGSALFANLSILLKMLFVQPVQSCCQSQVQTTNPKLITHWLYVHHVQTHLQLIDSSDMVKQTLSTGVSGSILLQRAHILVNTPTMISKL